MSAVKDAYLLTIPPPPVQGLGSAGGFKLMLEDRAGLGSEALVNAAKTLVAAANKDPAFGGVFTLFNNGSPSVYADIDRVKCKQLGVGLSDVLPVLPMARGLVMLEAQLWPDQLEQLAKLPFVGIDDVDFVRDAPQKGVVD